jgi:hypothetical protein
MEGRKKLVQVANESGLINLEKKKRGRREIQPKLRDIRYLYKLKGATNRSGDSHSSWLTLPEVVNVILLGLANPWDKKMGNIGWVEWEPELAAIRDDGSAVETEEVVGDEDRDKQGARGGEENVVDKDRVVADKARRPSRSMFERIVGSRVAKTRKDRTRKENMKTSGKNTSAVAGTEPFEEEAAETILNEEDEAATGTEAENVARMPPPRGVDRLPSWGLDDSDEEEESQRVGRQLEFETAPGRGNLKDDEKNDENDPSPHVSEDDSSSDDEELDRVVTNLVVTTDQTMRKIIEEGKGEVGKDYVNALQYLKHLGITMALVAEMQTVLAEHNLTMNLSAMRPRHIRVGDITKDVWLPRILRDLHCFQFENETTDEAQGEAGAMNERQRNFDHSIRPLNNNWWCPPWQVDETIVKEACDTVKALLYRAKELKHPTMVISKACREKVEFDKGFQGRTGSNLLLGPWDYDLSSRNIIESTVGDVITMPPAQNEQLASTPKRSEKKRPADEISRKSPNQDDNGTPGSRKSSRTKKRTTRYEAV